MRTKPQIIGQLLHPGVIAVVRTKRTDQAAPLTEALVAGGIIAVEITMIAQRNYCHPRGQPEAW